MQNDANATLVVATRCVTTFVTGVRYANGINLRVSGRRWFVNRI